DAVAEPREAALGGRAARVVHAAARDGAGEVDARAHVGAVGVAPAEQPGKAPVGRAAPAVAAVVVARAARRLAVLPLAALSARAVAVGRALGRHEADVGVRAGGAGRTLCARARHGAEGERVADVADARAAEGAVGGGAARDPRHARARAEVAERARAALG